jgi:hypothetical protein
MRYVKQPMGSNVCGQACVAMLADITLDEAIVATGRRGKTRTKDIKAGLTVCGILHGTRRIRGMAPKGVKAMLFWTGDKGCHWTVWHKNKHYDPVAGVYRKVPRWLEGSRVTSYLPIGEEHV